MEADMQVSSAPLRPLQMNPKDEAQITVRFNAPLWTFAVVPTSLDRCVK